jgi:hypothetical protein
VVGQIVFFSDIGMLSLSNIIVNKAIVLWPEVFDGCTVKKSSNKWKNYGNFIIIFRNPTDRPWQSIENIRWRSGTKT